MTRFSERIGTVARPSALQVDGISDALRNSLWNALYSLYENSTYDYWVTVANNIAWHFRKVPVDELPDRNNRCRDWVRRYFFELPWYTIYDLVEYIAKNHRWISKQVRYGDTFYHSSSDEVVQKGFNFILERELSAYRFVSGILSPISDKVESDAISDAIQSAETAGLTGAVEHLRTSLELLGKKPEPDYRNSIKEAISAVESVAIKISGSKSKSLDGALEKLSETADLHGALKAGFKSLYGYSSDAEGIRHAILEEPNVGFAEAKYMIVSCSAFVHYLIQKADDAGLLKKVIVTKKAR